MGVISSIAEVCRQAALQIPRGDHSACGSPAQLEAATILRSWQRAQNRPLCMAWTVLRPMLDGGGRG